MTRPDEVVLPRRRERFEDRRKERSHRKVLDEFFDHATLLAVSRLINRGLFDAVDYPISMGKEGGVFRASGSVGLRAVKVYRIGNTTFRNLPAYAMDELRRETSVRNFVGLISAWTRREHTLLGRLTDAGVRVPHPFGHFRNVLVMEYIGTAEGAAPRLRDAVIDDPSALYADLVEQIGRMLKDGRVVHGDLSPFNTLYLDGRVVLIDVAQAVSVDHPQARGLLVRDIENYARFLSKVGHEVTAAEFLRAVGGDTLGAPGAAAA